MEYRLLGPLSVCREGVELDLGTPKTRIILAMLLSRAGRPVSMEQLAGALWGDAPPKSAVKNVQTYVHRLRLCLGDPACLVRQGSGYLASTRREDLDTARFEDLAASGRALEAAGRLDEASRRLREALALWRGPAFAGMTDVATLAVESTRLEEERLSVLERRITVDLRLGRHGELLGELTSLTGQFPLRERLWGQLMLTLYHCGRRADALNAYTQARRTLIEEAGLDPGRELREIHQRILGQDVSLGPAAPLPATAGPARPAVVPRMLSSALRDFTGRQAELEAIEQVLGGERAPEDPTAVVTISGRAGSGKTSLAIQAAHRVLRAHPDGQLFATLATTESPLDPHTVLGRFLRTLGVPAAAVPDDEDERAGLYRSLLAERRTLVVLDDVRDEGQLSTLLPGSGTCGVLVTSRTRLGALVGAHRIALGDLGEPDGAALLRKVTGDRLAAADPAHLRTLVRLCAGSPLALRTAGSLLAARPHYRVADLVAGLTGARPLDVLAYGGLGVRSSLTPSYLALTPKARRLFRRLGALEEPDFAHWTAAAVLDVDPQVAQRLLDELIDTHLLDVVEPAEGPVRYRFHDLTRLYARERAQHEDALGRGVLRALDLR
ncbi:AfsR/SARP family transcriptional regulator [Actinomadura rugatobispora]|uniref:BTAD domain-containing putative transcriptional regulator n=1 Tax=Actinomadura rugatobispora TaxID=1994 RepID=A0ABW0ZQ71_9ACTN|nr:hypothetical protein GCM10010200_001290 [Actinomadura rugatobispora]